MTCHWMKSSNGLNGFLNKPKPDRGCNSASVFFCLIPYEPRKGLNHPEMPQRILDRLFLLRRAMRDNTLPFTDVVVLALLNAGLLLHLGNIDRGDLVSVFFADIGLNFIVCRFIVMNSQLLDIKIYVDMTVGFYPT